MPTPRQHPKNDPAFPLCVPYTDVNFFTSGMELRDYFAAQVIAAIVGKCTLSSDATHLESIARHAYKVANAMIEAR